MLDRKTVWELLTKEDFQIEELLPNEDFSATWIETWYFEHSWKVEGSREERELSLSVAYDERKPRLLKIGGPAIVITAYLPAAAEPQLTPEQQKLGVEVDDQTLVLYLNVESDETDFWNSLDTVMNIGMDLVDDFLDSER